MKQYIRFILITVLTLFLLTDCTDNFSELNTNPNTVTNAVPESLLSPSLYNFVCYNLGRNKTIGNELMQVTVTISNNNDIHRYDIKTTYSDGPWNNWYVSLNNFRKIYSIADELNSDAYKGIALVLDAWGTSIITDTYGDVPDSLACKGDEGILQPAFDEQEVIYQRIFQKLDSANVLLTRAKTLTTEQQSLDALYSGDLTKWRKFANSLHLRLLMRLSKRNNELNIAEKVNTIITNEGGKYPVFSSNDDSAILRFTGVTPLLSPFYNYTNYDFTGNTGLSEFFINTLMGFTDPRLPVWATYASLGAYWGMQSGYSSGNTPDPGSKLIYDLRNNPLLGNLMNYSELQFLKSEASTRNWCTVDAKTAYEEGVKASVALWIDSLNTSTSVTLKNHLLKDKVKWYDSDTYEQKMNKIFTQKYFSLMFTDFQQWFEYRRTGFPTLPAGPGLLNNGKMPVRLKYPVYVQNVNRESYQKAVEIMGSDDMNTIMWWNKN